MCEDEIYQNGNVICKSWIRGVPVKNERHALIPSVCGMLEYKELTLSFKKKIICVSYQTRYIMQKCLENMLEKYVL